MPDVISAIQNAMMDDDDNQSVRLVDTYNAADEAIKAVIDDVLIMLCGFSMPSLIRNAQDGGLTL